MKTTSNLSRTLGAYTSNKEGPLLFISAGIHGNEPSGVTAVKKILDELKKCKPEINGTVVAVSGNKAALEKNVRYIDEDLNRTWTKENIKSQKRDSHEKEEMFSIIDVLESYPNKDFTKRYFLDCHTTSSASIPYISVQDVNGNDAWAQKFPTYIIKGFSDIVSGCIDHYMSRTGLTGFVFEGGQHESPKSISHHEGIIWLAIAKACGLAFGDLTTYPESVENLLAKKSKQKIFEIAYRHALEDEDDFKMQSGYENFQHIKKGELLAKHNGKEVYSDYDGYIFMPLYQAQGNDGFFIVKEVKK